MTNIIDSLNWRYATKSFDTSKKVSENDLNEIIEAFRLSPSSFGLEPWKLIVVENQDLKKELVNHSFGQTQVGEASHLLVFTRVENIDDDYINKFFDNNSKITGSSREDLKGYEDVVRGFLSRLEKKDIDSWAREQVFLALGNVMTVLADKKIDSCAIGGFNPAGYDEVLNLKEKGLTSVVVLPIGYRSENDKYSKYPKVRFETNQISEIIK